MEGIPPAMASGPGPVADVCEHRIQTPVPLDQDEIEEPKSTPVKKAQPVHTFFSTLGHYSHPTLHSIGKQMIGSLVGPMPAREFLETFLPSNLIPDYSPVTGFEPSMSFKETTEALGELSMYAPFVKEMKPFASQLHFVDTHARGDKSNGYPFEVKPDVCVYPKSLDTPCPIRCDVSQVEVSVEFKWNNSDDPFIHSVKSSSCAAETTFVGSSSSHKDTLGQMGAYVSAQLSSQFRTHAFSVYILRSTARIIRWDREGAIVTEPIPYNTNSSLAEFFSRLSQAPPELRGIDTTVSEISGVEATRARAKLGLDPNVPMLKTIVQAGEHSSFPIIFAMPLSHPSLPACRGTRACPAYNVSGDRVVFFKDSWRIDADDITPEGRIYAELNARNVKFVPKCLASGDVECWAQQKLQTNRLSQSSWACKVGLHITPHSHYRLVLDIVGKSLMEFSSTKEMVQALHDALVAHSEAFDAGYIHRDISAGNIVVFDGHGYLIDWDLAKEKSLVRPRRITRTGTWQFMSIRLVEGQSKPHTFKDDLESAFWVLLWTALLFHPSELDIDSLSTFVRGTFECKAGMEEKRSVVTSQTKLTASLFPNHNVLFLLIKELADLFKGIYVVPTDADKEAYEHVVLSLNSTAIGSNAYLLHLLENSTAHIHANSNSLLEDHRHIISCFDKYLQLDWPVADAAQPQPLNGINSWGEENGHSVVLESKHILSQLEEESGSLTRGRKRVRV